MTHHEAGPPHLFYLGLEDPCRKPHKLPRIVKLVLSTVLPVLESVSLNAVVGSLF